MNEIPLKMKRFLVTVFLISTLSCSYQRVGNLTVVSTRNFQNSENYVELSRNVTGYSKLKKEDALQEAIDEAVNSIPGGEYMTNAVIYIKGDRAIKVTGDVYGQPAASPNTNNVSYSIGQQVFWIDNKNRTVKAEIISVNGDSLNVRLLHNDKVYPTTIHKIVK